MIALGAQVSTLHAKGGRTLPLEQLYAGYLETRLVRGELIAEVTIPRQGSWRAAYLKCTARSADDWPALGVAVALDTAHDGAIVNARIVIGAATDTRCAWPRPKALCAGRGSMTRYCAARATRLRRRRAS